MGRRSKVWPRKGRGYWSTVHGRQRYLGENLKKAREKLREILSSNKSTHHCDYSVRQLVDLFLLDCEKRVAAKKLSAYTLANLKSTLTRWAEACRRVKPEELRVFHLDRWLDSHPEWNQSSSSTAVRRVKTWAAFCKRKGYLDFNHLRDAIAEDQLKRDAADPADLARIEAAIDRDAFRDFFAVLHDTGCRPGELKTLTASNVDWSLSTAIVKGKSGERAIGLTPRALEILRRCSLARPDGALLRTVTGVNWSPRAIHQQWKRACRLAGVSGVVPNHCRHDLPRRWAEAGVSGLLIARQMGHTSHGSPHLGLLASTYFHPEARSLAEAAQMASGVSSKSRKRG